MCKLSYLLLFIIYILIFLKASGIFHIGGPEVDDLFSDCFSGFILFVRQTELLKPTLRTNTSRLNADGKEQQRHDFLPTFFAFLIRKMKHESFKSHLNQHEQRQQQQKKTKQYIISAHFQSLKSNVA